MNRREFGKAGVTLGLGALLGTPAPAQVQPPPSPTTLLPRRTGTSPRTYNQVQIPRPYVRGKRRFSVYWAWSYPWESNRDVTELDNRFSTITELRRVAWPAYEKPEYSEREFLQGIAGTLELFHLSLVRFQSLVGETTGHPVAVYQRVDQAGSRLPPDERGLAGTDTQMILGVHNTAHETRA